MRNAPTTCSRITQGRANTAPVSGESFTNDQRYGDRSAANQDAPHRYPSAIHSPRMTCVRRSSSSTTSIGVVTAWMRGCVNLRTMRATSPTRMVTPKVNAVTSRMMSRTGMLFHASVVRGKRKAVRCPKNTTRIPTWKGTVPQNRFLPSRNWEERDDTVKPLRR